MVRNYFAPVDARRVDDRGQTRQCQLNMLDALGERLDNGARGFWSVENGYTFSTAERLAALNEALPAHDIEALKDCVKVGVHADTAVTFATRFAEPAAACKVTQVRSKAPHRSGAPSAGQTFQIAS